MLPVLAIIIAIAALTIPASASAATTAAPPTTKLCKNFTGSPCWAKTRLPSGAPICEPGDPVPLFLRSGGEDCGPTGNLVLITCWFTGSPTVLGDDIQDHVTEETGGAQQLVGHIPDVYIDLGGHNPADVGIAHC
jgi:hypothetical protein